MAKNYCKVDVLAALTKRPPAGFPPTPAPDPLPVPPPAGPATNPAADGTENF